MITVLCPMVFIRTHPHAPAAVISLRIDEPWRRRTTRSSWRSGMEVFAQSNVPLHAATNAKRRKIPISDSLKCLNTRDEIQETIDHEESLDSLSSAERILLQSECPFERVYGTFGDQWYLFERKLEASNPSGMPALGEAGSEVERRRLDTIKSFWDAARKWSLSMTSVEFAYVFWGRLLQQHKEGCTSASQAISCKVFASYAVIAFRLALKFNERLETLWDVPKVPWEILDIFDAWPVDKSPEKLLEVECQSLVIVGRHLDAPVASKFFERLLMVGEWPKEQSKQYSELGHYLLALTQFDSGYNHLRETILPSQIAASALALAVKIINVSNTATDENNNRVTGQQHQHHQQYEYFPRRLEEYTSYSFKDLQPTIRRISTLLRSKPPQAEVLADFFPIWGRHEWM